MVAAISESGRAGGGRSARRAGAHPGEAERNGAGGRSGLVGGGLGRWLFCCCDFSCQTACPQVDRHP